MIYWLNSVHVACSDMAFMKEKKKKSKSWKFLEKWSHVDILLHFVVSVDWSSSRSGDVCKHAYGLGIFRSHADLLHFSSYVKSFLEMFGAEMLCTCKHMCLRDTNVRMYYHVIPVVMFGKATYWVISPFRISPRVFRDLCFCIFQKTAWIVSKLQAQDSILYHHQLR